MYFTHISTLQLMLITCQLEWIDFSRKMLHKNHLGKVLSKAAKAEQWKDLKISTLIRKELCCWDFCVFAVLVLLMQKVIRRLSNVMLCNFKEKRKEKERGKGQGRQRSMLQCSLRYHHKIMRVVSSCQYSG